MWENHTVGEKSENYLVICGILRYDKKSCILQKKSEI